ncbi:MULTISPECIES: hypothetical protein [Thermomonosporaceae]|uniref:hypothetical protein n=1 Tax=Thermomonosporaceae TaxID=2012 RepID=UPI00255AADEB|nr:MULTISPECIES: hypothetical protein [Thermomonosporaceae]MDL4776090.1 hypothetical protein [Actinomadura xylanilytica]
MIRIALCATLSAVVFAVPATSQAQETTTGSSASAAGKVFYVKGSSVSLNTSYGNGCKAWMNGRTPGRHRQGLVQSWGDYCTMALYHYKNGKPTRLSGWHSLNHGKKHTGFYSGSSGKKIWVCLFDRQGNPDAICSKAK